MNLQYITGRMAVNVDAIQSLLRGVADEQARWKPAPRKWSILEVINHLYDEERLDFRPRVDSTLHNPGKAWPLFDPKELVIERNYNERDFAQSIDEFLGERQKSLDWLGGLSSPDWSLSYEHPTIGELRAGDLLAAWLAHDLLHIRQLARLQVDYSSFLLKPYHVGYAEP
ncbi:MAG: DinB family protein [Candidatus Krumholzibacteria bacterium]|nr:DinB family protein [Candidatus Krumholzibacteria bacterium]